jgi:hypothetical protein
MSGLVGRPSLPTTLGTAAAAFLIALQVQAQSVAGVTPLKWRCVQTLDAQFNVACRPDAARTPVEPVAPSNTEAVMDTAPRALGLLPVAQRGAAEVFSTPAWLIPLHVAPVDTAHVQLLLESVLCGAQSQCKVTYDVQSSGAVTITLAGR